MSTIKIVVVYISQTCVTSRVRWVQIVIIKTKLKAWFKRCILHAPNLIAELRACKNMGCLNPLSVTYLNIPLYSCLLSDLAFERHWDGYQMVPCNLKVLVKFGLCPNCLQKLDECSLAHARKIFATARMLRFLLKFSTV